MAGGLPQGLVEHLRRVDLLIGAGEPPAHVVGQVLVERPALGVPEDDARPLLLEVEEVHLAAQTAVVALLRLRQHVEIGVELFSCVPGGAVDAGEHRVVGIAAPIGAGHLHQLEGVADLPGCGHVRTAAQVEPLALLVDLDLLVLGDRVDQLDLEHLALVGEDLLGLVPRPHLLGEGGVAPDDLAHLLFDRRQVVGGERLVAEEIVIEAVLDHRPDGDLRAGIELLHGLGHHMGGIVADEFQRAGIVTGDDLDRPVCLYAVAEVGQPAVQRHRHRLLGERFGNAFGDLAAGDAGSKIANGIIGESQVDHLYLRLTPADERG